MPPFIAVLPNAIDDRLGNEIIPPFLSEKLRNWEKDDVS
jgi:hypothetical protein